MGKEFTQDYLKQCLVYGKVTGRFTWLERPVEHFSSLSERNTWNAKKAGENPCYVDSHGYEVISLDGKSIKAHHAAFILTEGFKPDEVDHENGVRHDNRWVNIRSVSRAENSRNRKVRSDSGTGICGVSFRKDNNKWRAKITHEGKRISLGQFDTQEEAVHARLEAEKRYGYHENHGRVT